MTRSRLMNEIWRKIGEPPDLDPTTDVSYSTGPLLGWVVNEGQRAVARWKDPSNGQHVRMRVLFGEMYFQSKVYSGDIDATAVDESHVYLPAGLGTDDDQYNGWVFEWENETRLIVDYTGATKLMHLHEDLAGEPAIGDDYKLYKGFFRLLPSTHSWAAEHITLPAASDTSLATGNFIEVMQIADLTNTRKLSKAPAGFVPLADALSPGTPGNWYRSGKKIVMNCPMDEVLSFGMEYYREPTDVATDASEMEIPTLFHYGIALWGVWWGFNDAQDFQAAYAAKQNFNEFMRSVKSEYEVELERSDSHGSLQRE